MIEIRRTTAALALAALALAACSRDDGASLVKSAKDYLAKNDVRAAIIQLRNARQASPNDGEIRFLLGRALLETGDVSAAETELRKALELKYSPDAVYPLLAQATIVLGDFKKAVNEFGQVGLTDPKARAQVATSLAIAHMALGDMKQGRTAMEAALAADPTNVRANTVRAQLAARANDPAGAIAALDTALAAAPNDPEALVMKAELIGAQGRRDEGLQLLEKAAETNPFSLHPRFVLVSTFVARGQLDKAEVVLADMRKLSPQDFRTVYAEALVALSRNDAARARDLSQSLVAARPDHLPSLYMAALANYQLKNWTVAEDLLRKVIAQAPDDPGPRRVLAAGYLRSGRAMLALETVDAALRRSPDDPVLLRLAGEARIQTGNAVEAARYYERAAALDRAGSTSSQLRLAQIRLATGESGRALGDLERLAAKDDTQIDADLSLYAVHIRRREYDKALAAVASIEKKQGANALVHELRGTVYAAQRKYNDSRRELAKALDLEPKRLSAARSLAMIDLQEGKAADAKARYEKMIAADPKGEQPLVALAEIQALSGAPAAEVKATLDRAIAANPTVSGPRLALVSHYRRIGDTKGALEAARAASTALPADPTVTEVYGALLLATGDHRLARDTFTRLSQQLPHSPTPWLRIAEANVAARDYVSALDAQRKALSLQPENPTALVSLATTYLIAGKPEEAIGEAKKLQREKPKQAIGYALESELLAAQKKFSEATVPMKEALSRQPHPALAARQFVLLTAANRQAEANAFADKWTKDHPKDVTFLVMLGQQRQQRNETAGALAAYRAALEIDPDNVVVLNNLAWTLNEQGKPEARDYAERAYRLAPLNSNVVDTYGNVLVKQGDTARGVALIRMATNLQPNDQRLRINLARVLAKSGDKAGARRELEQIVSGDPRSPVKAEAEQLLKEL